MANAPGLPRFAWPSQMVDEGLITKEEAIFRVEPNQLYDFLVPRLDEKRRKSKCSRRACRHLPEPLSDRLSLPPMKRSKMAGARHARMPVILVRARNHAGRYSRHGSRGRNSDLARRNDESCCRRHARHGQMLRGRARVILTSTKRAGEMRVKGQVFKAGDWISLDGTTGRVIKGKLNTLDSVAGRPGAAEIHGLGRTVSHDESARQCRHSARCDSGAGVWRGGHRPLPHRAHVLRREEDCRTCGR